MTSRRALAIAAAFAAFTIGAPTAFADASFDPSIDVPVGGTGTVNVLPVALAILVGLGLVVLLRLRGPGPALTLIVALAGLAAGALFIAAGLIGDLSGQHRIFPIPVLIGIGIIAVDAIGLWRRGRARRLTPPAGAEEEHRVA